MQLLGGGRGRTTINSNHNKVYHYGKHMAQHSHWYWIPLNKMNVAILNLELPHVGHRVTGNIAAWMLKEYS